MSHTTEGQERPEVSVATWGSGDPGPVDGQPGTPPPKPPRPHKPPNLKPRSSNRRMATFNSVLEHYACINRSRPGDLEPMEAESKEAEPEMAESKDIESKRKKVGSWGWFGWGGPSPAQEVEAAPPVKPEVYPEVELEVCPPAELLPPREASPDAAVEPGPAPEETEAPPPLDGEPSLEPVLVPASKEALPVEDPTQGPKTPAQEAEAAPPVTSKVLHPEEQDAELEASPPAELSPPPADSPAAAVEPGPAPEETEAPPPLDEEPSLERKLVPASEEVLPVEAQLKGRLMNVLTLSQGTTLFYPHWLIFSFKFSFYFVFMFSMV
uniref:Uncharacterized protein n=1 Tax=Pipistrellus kuhlii TaxID=59472 RepID=A0A7J7W3P7_PIPKU|nr:hypothetical protein mPipKuh1_008189 [Pipistrellus kuhlii]